MVTIGYEILTVINPESYDKIYQNHLAIEKVFPLSNSSPERILPIHTASEINKVSHVVAFNFFRLSNGSLVFWGLDRPIQNWIIPQTLFMRSSWSRQLAIFSFISDYPWQTMNSAKIYDSRYMNSICPKVWFIFGKKRAMISKPLGIFCCIPFSLHFLSTTDFEK